MIGFGYQFQSVIFALNIERQKANWLWIYANKGSRHSVILLEGYIANIGSGSASLHLIHIKVLIS